MPQPLLPCSPSLNSKERTKSPYSASETSQEPRSPPQWSTPSASTFQSVPAGAGLETSDQRRAVQPFGGPASVKSDFASGAVFESAGGAATATAAMTTEKESSDVSKRMWRGVMRRVYPVRPRH